MHGETRPCSSADLRRAAAVDRHPQLDETFLTARSSHSLRPAIPGAEAGWVPYGDSGRKGLFSQGTFSRPPPSSANTSPTQRGLLFARACSVDETIEIRRRADGRRRHAARHAARTPANRTLLMSEEQACSGCHTLMDPIGFGLEAFDATVASARPSRSDRIVPSTARVISSAWARSTVPPSSPISRRVGQGRSLLRAPALSLRCRSLRLDEHDCALLERAVDEPATRTACGSTRSSRAT